jgi:hypothetical protein
MVGAGAPPLEAKSPNANPACVPVVRRTFGTAAELLKEKWYEKQKNKCGEFCGSKTPS